MVRRSKRPRLDREHAEYLADIAIELDESLALHRRARAELEAGGRVEAAPEVLLAPARRAAVLWLTVLWLGEGLAKELPDFLQPFPALRALDAVAWGLVAMAQDPPDLEAALTGEQLDALVDDDLREWLEFCLDGVRRTGWGS